MWGVGTNPFGWPVAWAVAGQGAGLRRVKQRPTTAEGNGLGGVRQAGIRLRTASPSRQKAEALRNSFAAVVGSRKRLSFPRRARQRVLNSFRPSLRPPSAAVSQSILRQLAREQARWANIMPTDGTQWPC